MNAGGAIEPRIAACDLHRSGIDIGGDDAATQGACRSDRQNAGAGADVENAPGRAGSANVIERDEAAARRAVMAGAEGQRRLDFDADAVWRHRITIMGAVDDEAAGADWLQPGEALAHPVFRRDGLEPKCFRGLGASGNSGQFAQCRFIGMIPKEYCNAPSAALCRRALPGIHKAHGDFIGRKALRQQIADPPRR